jgi:hypothetical protein
MDNTNEISHPVNITTQHQQFVVSKKRYLTFALLRFVVHAVVGIWIASILYRECLHCTDCNIVVLIFLSIISLGCFVNMGLPIEKLANVKVG